MPVDGVCDAQTVRARRLMQAGALSVGARGRLCAARQVVPSCA